MKTLESCLYADSFELVAYGLEGYLVEIVGNLFNRKRVIRWLGRDDKLVLKPCVKYTIFIHVSFESVYGFGLLNGLLEIILALKPRFKQDNRMNGNKLRTFRLHSFF